MTPADRAFVVYLLMGSAAVACALLAPTWAFILALGAVPTVPYAFAWRESRSVTAPASTSGSES